MLIQLLVQQINVLENLYPIRPLIKETIMTPTKTLFRLEQASGNGMWYDQFGEFNPTIPKLCPDSVNATLPMNYSDIYSKDGLVWNSSAETLEGMYSWFPEEDMLKLYEGGFELYRYEVGNWLVLPNQEIIFAQENVISKEIYVGNKYEIYI